MGAFSFSIPNELQHKLSKIANVDEIAPKMIDEAAPIAVKAIQAETPVKTGALKKSVRAKKAKKAKTGGYIGNITFDGYEVKKLKNGRTVKVANMQKAVSTQYGRKGQAADPFITRAIDGCSAEIGRKMKEVYERETK
ncbi:MAG: HK97 gp10 family phage protein [Clostridia bacterium]|nr:HK97 gp10 family phage protein [Clostridia bacterium]